jgi:phage shock protein A
MAGARPPLDGGWWTAPSNEDYAFVVTVPPAVQKTFEQVFSMMAATHSRMDSLEALCDTKAPKLDTLSALKMRPTHQEQKDALAALDTKTQQYLGMLKAETTSLDGRVSSIEASMAASTVEADLKQLTETVGDFRNEFTRDLKDTNDTNAMLRDRVEKMELALAAYIDTQGRVRMREMQEIRASLAETRTELMNQTNAALAEQAKKFEDDKKVLKSTVDTMAQEIQMLRRDSMRSHETISALKSQLEAANTRLANIEESVAAGPGSPLAATPDVDQILSRLSTKFQQLADEIAGVRKDGSDRYTSLQDSLAKLRSAADSSEDTVHALQREMAALRATVSQGSKSESGVSASQLLDLNTRIENVGGRVAATEDDLKTVHFDLSICTEKLAKEVSRLDAALAAATARKTDPGELAKMGSLREAVAALEEALSNECDQRRTSVEDVLKMQHHLRRQLLAQLEEYARWDDVQRALWQKADRSQLPMALTTEAAAPTLRPSSSRGSTSSGVRSSEDKRCVSCNANVAPPLPPLDLAGTQFKRTPSAGSQSMSGRLSARR